MDLELKDSLVVGLTSQGAEIRAPLLRLTRHQAVFEIYSPDATVRISEVLNEFKIALRGRAVYSGRAVVASLVNTGLMVICQASLNEQFWTDVEAITNATGKDRLRHEFRDFIAEWQKLYLVSRDYKVVIADLQSFLNDLRLWLHQVELNIRAEPGANRAGLEQEIALELRDSIVPR
jgi:extracellular factor (EF) 3-hydroxypalmitic acid methyl ester biosynthesis protein